MASRNGGHERGVDEQAVLSQLDTEKPLRICDSFAHHRRDNCGDMMRNLQERQFYAALEKNERSSTALNMSGSAGLSKKSLKRVAFFLTGGAIICTHFQIKVVAPINYP